VAKSSRSKKRPAPSKAPARGGRPAGLFTWLAVGLVVVVVAGLVIIKFASGGPSSSGSSAFQPINPTTFSELTTVPASVFNTVGATSAVGVTAPQAVKSQPALTEKSATGTTVPEVLYIGAEYCPYCGAQRWATIIALSRFGTWAGLGDMTSASGDVYPNTPTFTFVKATFTSKYVAFKSVEEYKNTVNPATNYYYTLQSPTATESALIKKYDSSKYITGLTSSEDGSIPFIDFANQFLVAGASYSPTTLSGSSRDAIAAGLTNAASPITDAIIASANDQSAAICSITKQQPSNVCTSAGVKAADTAMGLK
jgi:hypothetical protein